MNKFFKAIAVILSIGFIILVFCYFTIVKFRERVNNFFGISQSVVVPPSEDNAALIKEMQQQITSLSENVEGLLVVVADKENEIQVMTYSLKEAEEKVDSQSRAIDTLCDEIDAKNNTISSLETENHNYEEQIRTMNSEHAEEILTYQAKIDEDKQTIALLENEINSYNTELERLNAELTTLKENEVTNAAKIEEIENQILNIQNEVSNAQSKIEENTTEISSIKENISTLAGEHASDIENLLEKISQNSSSINALQTSINSLTADLSTAKTELEVLKGKVEDFESKIATANEEVATMRNNLSSLNTTVNELQSSVNLLKSQTITFTSGTNSYGEYNYIKIPSAKVLIQWGKTNSKQYNDNAEYTVMMGALFANANYTVTVTPSTMPNLYVFGAWGNTRNSFLVKQQGWGNGAITCSLYWIAIGTYAGSVEL